MWGIFYKQYSEWVSNSIEKYTSRPRKCYNSFDDNIWVSLNMHWHIKDYPWFDGIKRKVLLNEIIGNPEKK